MKAEMSEHLGYESGESKPAGQPNQRNGVSGKTVITFLIQFRDRLPMIQAGRCGTPQAIGDGTLAAASRAGQLAAAADAAYQMKS